jgi:hypothetical protein
MEDDHDQCPAHPIRRRGEEKRPDLNCVIGCKGYRMFPPVSFNPGVGCSAARIKHLFSTSLADSGCLSRILIFIRPGSRIQDPGSNNSTKRGGGGGGIFFVLPFFEQVKKIILAKTLLRTIVLLTQRFVIKLQK